MGKFNSFGDFNLVKITTHAEDHDYLSQLHSIAFFGVVFWNDTREQSFVKSSRHQADVVGGIGFGDVDLPCSLLATRRSRFLAAESEPCLRVAVSPFPRPPSMGPPTRP